MAADHFDLFALPKPALALVVAALPHADRELLPLVCRSWAEAFAAEPAASTQLVVHVRKLEGYPMWQRVLAARGRHTEQLTLHTACESADLHGSAYVGGLSEGSYDSHDEQYDSEGEELEPEAVALDTKLLRCFAGGRLRRLTVVGCIAHSALRGPLAAGGTLQHLELRHTAAEQGCCGMGTSCCARRLLDGVEGDEDLAMLAGLGALSLRLPQLEDPLLLLDDLAGCSGLTALELGGVSTESYGDEMEDLASLTSLRRLVLRAENSNPNRYAFHSGASADLHLGGSPEGGGQFPLAPLSRLTCLVLAGSTGAHPGLGRPLNSYIGANPPSLAGIGIGEGLAGLPQLRELHMDGLVQAVPADLWQCTSLSRLVVRSAVDSGADEMWAELPPLDGARLPHLRALCLRGCAAPTSLAPSIVAAAPQLTALALGDLEFWSDGAGGSGNAMGLAQLAKLTALQELDLSSFYIRQKGWDEVLPALQPLTSLRILRLADCDLRNLPEQGPYARLEELDLSENHLLECPAWLPGACPRLRVLNIGFNGEEKGTYEDPNAMALTPAIRELATRSSGARLEVLTVTWANYFRRGWQLQELEPLERAARAILDELLALEEAGQLELRVADQRFLECLEQPRHESWL